MLRSWEGWNQLPRDPAVAGRYERYAKDGFTIVGVHSPEFDWEKPYDKVVDATKKLGRTTRSCRTTR